ncbi:MAG: UDP-N-acetylmuramoyl-L-alanine--D-glutamate ligase [Candidatus Levyibacteriota bacterium]
MNNQFKNKKIAIVGLGIEGLSSAKFFIEKRAEVTILDKKEKTELNLDTPFVFGKNYLDNLDCFDVIVRSPGVKVDLPNLQKAKEKGTVITSQIKLFFDLCPCKIIGVTGTKGKGTTASLIYEMFKKQTRNAYLGGNIGLPPLDFLDKLNSHSIVVLELSSFQLQDLKKSPHIAVILMTLSEHLDYHKDVEEYVSAKRNIVKFQKTSDFAILNIDYPASRESDIHTQGKVFYISREGEVGEGCFVKKGEIKLKIKNEELKIIDTKEILLPGEHNFENVCAAVMAVALCNVSKENIIKVLKTFKGLEHRLELVGEVGGVKYYDDSFSTTPETAIAAILAFKNPEILILGGSSKNSDFSELGKVISNAKNIKAIIGIGLEWKRIKSTIRHTLYAIRYIEGLKNMHSIIQKASEIAEVGDIVLLSPACASFDMFKNYKDRGRQFREEVENLKK